MGKKTKSTKRQKQQYRFMLKGSKSTYYRNKIQVDFMAEEGQHTLPRFNRDRHHYTPSFIVPTLYHKSKVDYLSEHNNKVLASAEKSENKILVPRPSPTKNYCAVCSQEYEDYLNHVNGENHKKQLTNSKFYNQIKLLCQKVKLENEELKQNCNQSVNSKTSLATEAHSEEDSVSKEGLQKSQTQFINIADMTSMVL